MRLLIVAVATSPSQIVANQFLDGVANGLFSVLAATWVTDRMAGPRHAGTAQALVGTSLVLGSAIGPRHLNDARRPAATAGCLRDWPEWARSPRPSSYSSFRKRCGGALSATCRSRATRSNWRQVPESGI